jgi:hypothetical protein
MARVWGPPLPSTGAGPRLYQYDTLLGWEKRPRVELRVTAPEWDVMLATNEHGLRGPPTPRAKPDGTRRVLLLGDSYVEAYTVSEQDMVSTVLERTLQELGGERVEVLNGGTAGYSTDQQLLFFSRDGVGFEPDVTVLFFYVNDVWYNARSSYWRGSKPYFELSDGALELRGVPVPRLAWTSRELSDGLSRGSALYQLIRSAVSGVTSVRDPAPADSTPGGAAASPTPSVPGELLSWQRSPDAETLRTWRITEALLVELRDRVEAAGSDFLIFWVPSKAAVHDQVWRDTRDAYGMSDEVWSAAADADMLRSVCEVASLSCLIPLQEFRERAAPLGAPRALYFPVDGHWTATGHHLAAEILARAIAVEG